MKNYFFIMLQLFLAVFVSRYFYVEGYKEAEFDRAQANLKLQQCLEVVRVK